MRKLAVDRMTAYWSLRFDPRPGPKVAFGAIVLKNSFSVMFNFLGGLRARHSKISWGTSQFVDWAACKVLNRSEMVLSGDVPSDGNLASFRPARFVDFFNIG